MNSFIKINGEHGYRFIAVAHIQQVVPYVKGGCGIYLLGDDEGIVTRESAESVIKLMAAKVLK